MSSSPSTGSGFGRPLPPHRRAMGDKRALSRRRRSRGYRETPEVADGVGRIILAVGKRIATEDPADLEILLGLDVRLSEAWALAVAGIRRSGFSDAEIGAVLGVTKQAVQQRWPRSNQEGGGE